jgi:hypothetical protein
LAASSSTRTAAAPGYGSESDTGRRPKPHDADLQNEPDLIAMRSTNFSQMS